MEKHHRSTIGYVRYALRDNQHSTRTQRLDRAVLNDDGQDKGHQDAVPETYSTQERVIEVDLGKRAGEAMMLGIGYAARIEDNATKPYKEVTRRWTP